ncbi:MAG: helix-turn-helix domain-containing protein [Omnitrophica WOR_2 bacterium]
MSSAEWLSLSQVAEVLGVHPSTVRAWADQGRLPVHRTRGGHRRFRRSEVELCMNSQSDDGASEADQVIQTALKNTRLQVVEGHLEAEEWYRKLDEDAKEQYRRGGRNLLQGLIAYQSSDEQGGKAEARAIGYEYASIGRRYGLNSVEAVHAFLYFRNLLLNSMLSVYESASVRSPYAWGDMLRKTSTFTDQILITLLETYEAYQRNNR